MDSRKLSGTIIVACSEAQGIIGVNGTIPWKCPEDFRHFKRTTSGGRIIMGRKTYESLPNGALPKRRNVVLTRNPEYRPEGCETADSIMKSLVGGDTEEKRFIIGGGELYEKSLTLGVVNKCIVTLMCDMLINTKAGDEVAYFRHADLVDIYGFEITGLENIGEWRTEDGKTGPAVVMIFERKARK